MTSLKKIKTNWSTAVSDKVFLYCLLIGLTISGAIVVTQPIFYRFLEARNGLVLNDILLGSIEPANVSVPIFILIWGMVFLGVARSLFTPRIFLNYMTGFILVTFMRMICLSLVPLNAPIGIVELKDPLTDVFYGGTFITKDLFFSGHTATLVLLFLSFEKRNDKIFAGIAAVLVAALLLVQHVHYTIDVMAAPFFSWIGFKAGQKLLSFIRFKFHVGLLPAQ